MNDFGEPNPFLAAVKLRAINETLAPKLGSQNRELAGPTSALWRQNPYPHEVSVLSAYAGMSEKMHRDGINFFIPGYKTDVARLLSYIAQLKLPQVVIGKGADRTLNPPLLDIQVRTLMQQQIDQLSRVDFTDRDNWPHIMINYLKVLVDKLIGSQLLTVQNIRALDEMIAENSKD